MQIEDAANYHNVRGPYFLAVAFVATVLFVKDHVKRDVNRVNRVRLKQNGPKVAAITF